MAAGASVDLAAELEALSGWQQEFSSLMVRIGSRFERVEPRRRVARFLRGMLAGLPRTNCWSLAEHAGERDPRGMQRLLSQAVWDADGVRDELRAYVVDELGDPSAVLVVDETGDVKKGNATVGVQRQYTGTAGRIENSQVAVYLTYAGPRGYAMIDRALYLPRAWTDDPDRCGAAGIPEETKFATKPALARQMIERTLTAGASAAWVTGDEVYGADPGLRTAIAAHGLGFVLAVAKTHRFTTGIGTRRAIDLAVRLPARAWQRLSAGAGAKGERWYDWALIDTTDPALDKADDQSTQTALEPARSDPPGPPTTRQTGLLIRRSITSGEYAFYRICSPRPVRLADLVRVAGIRWKVEESFAGSKELAALDQHQVRGWTSWHRWTVLAMLAHAFLSVLTATQHHTTTASTSDTDHAIDHISLIALTRNEIRRLFTGLLARVHPADFQLHWSRWRRHHQAIARRCHYKHQTEQME